MGPVGARPRLEAAREYATFARVPGLDQTEFLHVCAREDLTRAGGSVRISVGGKGVAIFEGPGGELHAVQNACPHRGAPLVGGHVRTLTEGLFVICPAHAGRFRLTDGICPEAGPECSLLVWDVKVDEGQVYVSRLPRLTP